MGLCSCASHGPASIGHSSEKELDLVRNEMQSQLASALSILQSTGADVYFSCVVDSTLRKLRTVMSAPAPGTDPQVDEEFAAVQQQLAKFYPEYRNAYAGLLVKHVDAAALPEAATLLASDAASAYFRAVRAMDPELGQLFDELGARMLQHARYRTAG
jgi:hypothetical protein